MMVFQKLLGKSVYVAMLHSSDQVGKLIECNAYGIYIEEAAQSGNIVMFIPYRSMNYFTSSADNLKEPVKKNGE